MFSFKEVWTSMDAAAAGSSSLLPDWRRFVFFAGESVTASAVVAAGCARSTLFCASSIRDRRGNEPLQPNREFNERHTHFITGA